MQGCARRAGRRRAEAARSVPEDQPEQDDYRDRHAQQPQQYALAHGELLE
jgi:hypothetical protein